MATLDLTNYRRISRRQPATVTADYEMSVAELDAAICRETRTPHINNKIVKQLDRLSVESLGDLHKRLTRSVTFYGKLGQQRPVLQAWAQYIFERLAAVAGVGTEPELAGADCPQQHEEVCCVNVAAEPCTTCSYGECLHTASEPVSDASVIQTPAHIVRRTASGWVCGCGDPRCWTVSIMAAGSQRQVVATQRGVAEDLVW